LGFTGEAAGSKAVFFSKGMQKWLYYDPNCNGRQDEEMWAPQWVITPTPPSSLRGVDLDGDGSCNAKAYTGIVGELKEPSSGNWQVDCNGDGLHRTALPVHVEKSGLVAEFWAVGEENIGNFEPPGEVAAKRIDARVDYWATDLPWDNNPANLRRNFFARWSGYLKVQKPGAYEFKLGSSDNAKIDWITQDGWGSSFEFGGPTGDVTFAWSGVRDHTRSLDTGYHGMRVSFRQSSNNKPGVVLMWSGPDSYNQWKVVPSSSLAVDPPECLAPGPNGMPGCKEGVTIPAGGDCTVNVCPDGKFASPAIVKCDVRGFTSTLEKFTCSDTPPPVQPAVPEPASPDSGIQHDYVPSIVPA
jgi:hypothetical protein